MKLMIGCPLYKREWILHHWIRCIISQSIDVSKIGFVFEVSPDDTATITILETWRSIDKSIPYFNIKVRDDIPHFEHVENGRNWTLSKYENMVSLRNSLLSTVREVEPDFYFSLDSDILIENPNTLELLIGHVKSGFDGVNPLMFMTPFGDMYPSVMDWRHDGSDRAMRHQRYPLGTFLKSDVIMAAKMMSKKLYSEIDYRIHEQGEDVGWSYDAHLKGMKLGCASYIYAPHIMSEEFYRHYLENGDSRLQSYSDVPVPR